MAQRPYGSLTLPQPLLVLGHRPQRIVLVTQAQVRQHANPISHVLGMLVAHAPLLTTNLVWVLALELLVVRLIHLVALDMMKHHVWLMTMLTAVHALGAVLIALVLMREHAIATLALVAHPTSEIAHLTQMAVVMALLALPTTQHVHTTLVLELVLERHT